MLELSHITKHYADDTALRDLSLVIPDGRTTVLIGPSGCGKSTLLRTIIGLIKPDNGKVEYRGDTIELSRLNQFRQQVGYVIQDGGLFPHLTAVRNITLMAEYLAWEKDRIDRRLEILNTMFQMPDSVLQRYPVELSGGQQQRISLMRALMLDPEILLMDEPLGALDPMIRFELQHELKKIFGELNKTVVMVTHDVAEAAFFADNIVLIRLGEIVQQGGIEELLSNPAEEFVTDFINAQKSHWTMLDEI